MELASPDAGASGGCLRHPVNAGATACIERPLLKAFRMFPREEGAADSRGSSDRSPKDWCHSFTADEPRREGKGFLPVPLTAVLLLIGPDPASY
jgi:hypothetical protein